MSSAASRWPGVAAEVADATLARFADDVDRQGRWPLESVQALTSAGLFGLTIPTADGGHGEGPRTFAAVTRVLAERCASTAMIHLMHVCAAQVVVAAKQFPLRQTILQDAAGSRHLLTLAFSERGSRSHFWAPVSQATLTDQGHHLNATKSFVTSAGKADGYVVSTRSAGAAEPLGSTLYYLPAGTPGVTVAGPWDGLRLRGNASAPLRLENVAVPGSYRLSEEGKGLDVMLNVVLPWFQVGSAAVSVGIARAATAGAKKHLMATPLEHLGQTLGAIPTLRARLAQMQIAVDAQQAFLECVAASMEAPGPDTLLAVLECKAAAAEAALLVTDLALRIGGGASFSRGLTIERNFRDARAASIMAPTTDLLYDFIGKALLGMPLL